MRTLTIIIILVFTPFAHTREYQAGDHELLLMPTAYTMPAGSSYFSDSDLLFITYGAAISSRTHLGAFTVFPIVETITFGIKQNYFRTEFAEISCWVTLTPGIPLVSIGNVASFGNRTTSVHLGICAISEIENIKTDLYFNSRRENRRLLHLAGIMTSLMNETSLIAEYASYGSFFDNGKTGLLSLGFRIRNIRNTAMSVDIGGIIPTGEKEKFNLYPLLKATALFR